MDDGLPELLDRCAAGDRVALEALYRRYADIVWRHGWYRTHSREAAAEVVQETFLRVVRSIGQFQRRSSFTTWLFAITRSVAVEHNRRARRNRTVDLGEDLPSGGPAVCQGMTNGETRDAVRDAVAHLPGAHKDAIVLCELSGLSIREAAGVLGWGESRVKVTLHRARRRLGEMLKGCMLDDGSTTRRKSALE